MAMKHDRQSLVASIDALKHNQNIDENTGILETALNLGLIDIEDIDYTNDGLYGNILESLLGGTFSCAARDFVGVELKTFKTDTQTSSITIKSDVNFLDKSSFASTLTYKKMEYIVVVELKPINNNKVLSNKATIHDYFINNVYTINANEHSNLLQELEEDYTKMKKEYNGQKNDNGLFINKHNQKISPVSIKAKEHNTQKHLILTTTGSGYPLIKIKKASLIKFAEVNKNKKYFNQIKEALVNE